MVNPPADWVYPVNDHSAESWGYKVEVETFFRERHELESEWFLPSGFRQMREGDLIWVYGTSPRQHILAAGTAEGLPEQSEVDGTWWVWVEWDFELTDALIARPAAVLDSVPRTVRRLSPVESDRLAVWLATAPRGTGSTAERGRRRVLAEITARQGQPVFRQRLLAAYGGRCAISGCPVPEVLQAAHIDPYDGPASNIMPNGLLLRGDLHNLFDSGLLWIDRNLRVRVAPELGDTEYGSLDGRPLRAPDRAENGPDPAALRRHRQRRAAAPGRRPRF